jgi:hypothetical protein
MTSDREHICVIGAGVIGRGVCHALEAAGASCTLLSRRSVPGATRVDLGDARALAALLDGARVVVNAAAPLRETALPVLDAALAVGAHYLDVGGEQAVLHALYERRESAVRHAGRVALPGAGLDCVLGDLAAAWAAAAIAERDEPRPADSTSSSVLRDAPIERTAEDRPLDEVTVTYVFDDLVLSAGSQRALFGRASQRALVWHRDRWEPGRIGEARRINAGGELGGERDAIAHAGGDVLSIPRHVAAHHVATFVSTTRNPARSALLRAVATALPLIPRAASELLAPYAPDEAELARARFAVIAEVRRGFASARIAIRGGDPYRTTATIAAWLAQRLATREVGPIGMCAPAELLHPAPALRALAAAAGLVIEPSFA